MDAGYAGEGNLEIVVREAASFEAAHGNSLPTRVTPLGNAVFRVDFVPIEAIDHLVHVTFNEQIVPGILIA